MNKKEAIEKILKNNHTKSGLDFDDEVRVNTVIEIITQIDEPEKPIIPQFVADWIEKCKAKKLRLFDAIMDNEAVDDWLDLGDSSNEDLFARAWLDGYNIEQEKLYTVEIPNPYDKQIALRLEKWVKEKVRIVTTHSTNDFTNDMHLTEQEIRKDFEWAWQWAEPVEE